MIKKIFLLLMILFYLSQMLFADKFYLEDGSTIEGEIIDTTGDMVIIKTDYGTLSLKEGEYYSSFKSHKRGIRIKKELQDKRKKHFFEISFLSGVSPTMFSMILITLGGSFGYQYAFTPNFAFGGGISFFLPINPFVSCENQSLFLSQSNVMVMLQFMVGDLEYGKIAFVFGIGGGYGYGTKIGLYYRGFLIKVGWNISSPFYFVGTQGVTIDIGYKFNWGR